MKRTKPLVSPWLRPKGGLHSRNVPQPSLFRAEGTVAIRIETMM